MKLQMRSQQALIGIQTQKATFNQQTTLPKLNLQIEAPEIQMETTQPKVYIDQTEAFADAGLKTSERFTKDNAQEAQRLMLQGIARAASQGNQLAEIQNVSDDTVIANQAYENAFGQFEYDWGYTHIPKSGPEFTPVRGEVNISLKRGSVSGQLQKGTVDHEFRRGKVDIYLRQKNSLKITVVEDRFDMKV
jgi:hypothetical protein